MPDDVERSAAALYGDAVARVHHEGFLAPAQQAAGLLVTVLGEGHGRRVLDLGCGSGAAARLLVDAGYDVIGLDPAPAMIELARAHVPEATFAIASVHAPTPLPRAAAALLVGEVVNYSGPAGEPSVDALRGVLSRVAEALGPEGVVLLDVACHGRAGGAGAVPRRTQVGDRVVESVATEAQGTLTRQISVLDAHGSPISSEGHTLHLFEPDEVEAALAEAGLASRRLPQEEAWTQGAPAWFAWQAWGPGFDPRNGARVP